MKTSRLFIVRTIYDTQTTHQSPVPLNSQLVFTMALTLSVRLGSGASFFGYRHIRKRHPWCHLRQEWHKQHIRNSATLHTVAGRAVRLSVSIIRLSVSKEPQVEIRAMKMSCRLRARFHANILKMYKDCEWTATLSNFHFRLFKE